jgi:hypothetical protein
MQKVRNRPHNILFSIQKLTDVMGKACSFCGKALRRMESTSDQRAKGRFEEQMCFKVINIRHLCNLKNSNSSEWIVMKFDIKKKVDISHEDHVILFFAFLDHNLLNSFRRWGRNILSPC